MKKVLMVLVTGWILLSITLVGCVAVTPPPAPETAASPEAPAAAPEEEGVTITFWNGVGAPENVVLSEMIADYNETNTDGITVEEVLLDWDTLYSKILLDYRAGNAPDVSTMHQTNLPQEVDLGVLAPVAELASEIGLQKDDFVAKAWDATFVNGEQYAIPLDMHPLALYYNVKLFEEAGLDPDNPPTNKDEFLDALQKLTKDTDGDGTPDQYGLGLAYSGGIPFRVWMSLVWQHEGGQILTDDGTQAAFDTPAGVESLQFLQDLVYEYGVIPEQEQSPDDDFVKGIVAMDISGPWSMFDFNKAEDLDYRTAPLPVIYDQPAAWGNSHTLVLPNTENPAKMEAGMKLIKYLSDNTLKWTREAGHLPVRNDVLQSAEFKELDKSQAFAESLETAHYYPSIIQQSEVFGREATSPFVILIESAMLNQTTPEEAVATAADTINDILE